MAKIEQGRGPFFVQIPMELQLDERLNSTDIAVYASLRSFADFGKATGARPSDPIAAKRARCSTRSFGISRMRLREFGWISWEKKDGKANVYTIHNSREENPAESAVPAEQTTAESAVVENQTPPQNLLDTTAESAGLPPQNLPTTDIHNREPIPKQTSDAVASARWQARCIDVWTDRFGPGSAPGGEICGQLAHLIAHYPEDEVVEAWKKYLSNKTPEFASAGDFRKRYAYYKETGGKLPEAGRSKAGGTLAKQEYAPATKADEVRFKR